MSGTIAAVPLAAAALLAGAIAAVTGFGIGSLLAPVLALRVRSTGRDRIRDHERRGRAPGSA